VYKVGPSRGSHTHVSHCLQLSKIQTQLRRKNLKIQACASHDNLPDPGSNSISTNSSNSRILQSSEATGRATAYQLSTESSQKEFANESRIQKVGDLLHCIPVSGGFWALRACDSSPRVRSSNKKFWNGRKITLSCDGVSFANIFLRSEGAGIPTVHVSTVQMLRISVWAKDECVEEWQLSRLEISQFSLTLKGCGFSIIYGHLHALHQVRKLYLILLMFQNECLFFSNFGEIKACWSLTK
jgi:hypothetical protein